MNNEELQQTLEELTAQGIKLNNTEDQRINTVLARREKNGIYLAPTQGAIRLRHKTIIGSPTTLEYSKNTNLYQITLSNNETIFVSQVPKEAFGKEYTLEKPIPGVYEN